MVEMRSHLAIERARLVTLHLQQARRSSIPTALTKNRSGWDHWMPVLPPFEPMFLAAR